MAKKYSEKTVLTVIGGMLKYCRKNDPRECLGYSWFDSKGRQCAINGFIAFRLAAPVAGLPDMPAHCTPIDLDRVFPAADGLQALPTPDAADVAALIAYDRGNGKTGNDKHGLYAFGEGLPVVNEYYLRDVLKVYPDARFYYSNNIYPIYVKSEHGDGVIMPVRVDDEAKRARRVVTVKKPINYGQAWSLAAFAARFAS